MKHQLLAALLFGLMQWITNSSKEGKKKKLKIAGNEGKREEQRKKRIKKNTKHKKAVNKKLLMNSKNDDIRELESEIWQKKHLK